MLFNVYVPDPKTFYLGDLGIQQNVSSGKVYTYIVKLVHIES